MKQELQDELAKLARMLAPTAIPDEYAIFKKIHEILVIMSEEIGKEPYRYRTLPTIPIAEAIDPPAHNLYDELRPTC
jgi:hypothetical protein